MLQTTFHSLRIPSDQDPTQTMGSLWRLQQSQDNAQTIPSMVICQCWQTFWNMLWTEAQQVSQLLEKVCL